MLCRYEDQFVLAAFDNAPTADADMYTKLDKSVRDAYESRVSYVTKWLFLSGLFKSQENAVQDM